MTPNGTARLFMKGGVDNTALQHPGIMKSCGITKQVDMRHPQLLRHYGEAGLVAPGALKTSPECRMSDFSIIYGHALCC